MRGEAKKGPRRWEPPLALAVLLALVRLVLAFISIAAAFLEEHDRAKMLGDRHEKRRRSFSMLSRPGLVKALASLPLGWAGIPRNPRQLTFALLAHAAFLVTLSHALTLASLCWCRSTRATFYF